MVATADMEDMSRSLGRLEGQVGSVESRLGGIEQRTEDISRSLGRLEGQVDGVENRLGSIEQRLDRVIFALFGFGAALTAGIVGILVKLFLDAA